MASNAGSGSVRRPSNPSASTRDASTYLQTENVGDGMNRIAGRSPASSGPKRIMILCNRVHSACLSHGAIIELSRLHPVSSMIRIRCQILEQFKKLRRLAAEEPHGRQEVHHAHGNPRGLGRANDRACREAWAQEWARLRHNQVAPKNLPSAAEIR